MSTLNHGKVPRQIVFNTKLNDIATKKANIMGVSFPEYIRYLVLRDNADQFNQIEMVSEQTEAEIAHSINEYIKGNFTELKTPKKIESHFEDLEKE
jgi:hypothetical protein